MITPDKVQQAAELKEEENYRFRTFLKGHADEKKLDKQFLELHNELFSDYDCSKCRNCCRLYKGSIPTEDIENDARHLGISEEQFIKIVDSISSNSLDCRIPRKFKEI